MSDPTNDRARLRREARERRDREPDRAAKSLHIHRRVHALPELAQSRTVCSYIGIGSEVATLPLVAELLAGNHTVVVPVCRGDELALVSLVSVGELVSTGRFGLLEPPAKLAALPARTRPADAIDLFLVPGVAFDREGNRLGYGRGYYDRLLAGARPDAALVGLAFECQLVPRIPREPHDVQVDRIVTEAAVHASPAGR